jgi:hypothetical protein
MFRFIPIIRAAAGASVVPLCYIRRAHMDTDEADKGGAAAKVPVEKIIIEDTGDDEAWEAEKQKCSFCKQFLDSPCKVQFKGWSKCVDKAKELNIDFVAACTDYTDKLLDCTSANNSFFAKVDELHPTDDDDDNDEEELGTDSEEAPDSEADIQEELEKEKSGQSQIDVAGQKP